MAKISPKEYDFGVDLRDFRSAGDGIKDDTDSILSAIEACPEGGRVLIPPGTYLFNKSIVISKTIKLQGTGAAELWYDTAPGASKLLKSASLNGAGIRLIQKSVMVEALSLDGQPGNGGDGISIEASHCSVRDVMVIRQGRDGVRIGTDGSENANLWNLDRVSLIANGRHGLNLHSGSYNSNAGSAINVSAIINAANGINLNRSLSNTFVGTLSEGNAGFGFYFDSFASRHVLLNAYPDSNTGGGFKFESSTRGNVYIPSPEQSIVDLGQNINLLKVQLKP